MTADKLQPTSDKAWPNHGGVTRRSLIALSTPLLAGCNWGGGSGPVVTAPGGPAPSSQPDDTIRVGGNLFKSSASTAFPFGANLPQDMGEIYARLQVTPEFARQGWQSSVPAPPGTFAARFWSSLRNQIGADTTNYSVTLSMSVGGTNLTYPVASLSLDTRGPRILTEIHSFPTPWFKIQPSSGLPYTMDVRTSAESTVTITRAFAAIGDLLRGAGALVGAGPTAGLSVVAGALSGVAMKQVAELVDERLSAAYAPEVNSSAAQTLGPSQRIDDAGRFFRRRDDWTVRALPGEATPEGAPLINIRVEMEFASNLVVPEAVRLPLSATAGLRSFTPSQILANCAVPLQGSQAPVRLSELTGRQGSPLFQLQQAIGASPTSPTLFNATCYQAFASLVGDYGLTSFDALRAIFELAVNNNIREKRELLATPFVDSNATHLQGMGLLLRT